MINIAKQAVVCGTFVASQSWAASNGEIVACSSRVAFRK